MSRMMATSLIFALLASGCVSTPRQTYPGPELPLSEVAVLRDSRDAAVWAIDAAKPSGGAWAILPGLHEVHLRVRLYTQAPNVSWTIWTYCRVRLHAQPGGRYVGFAEMKKEVAPGLSERVTIEIGIAEGNGETHALAHACSDKRPSIEN